jgi:hypothetical protein
MVIGTTFTTGARQLRKTSGKNRDIGSFNEFYIDLTSLIMNTHQKRSSKNTNSRAA